MVPGNRVLLRAPNTPWLVACWFGVIKAGGVVVTTMPLLRAPELAKLIEDDAAAAAKAGDVPSLEGDPFIDAQDWQINSFAIAVKDTGPDKALGTVKFNNLKENMAVELDLVKLKEGWRIDEIRTKTGSLRDLFKKK